MIAIFFFTIAVTAAVLTANALRRPVPPGRPFPPPWLPAMVVSELAPILAVAVAGIVVVSIPLGITRTKLGTVGVWLLVAVLVGLTALSARSVRSAAEMGNAPSLRPLFDYRNVEPDGVVVERGIRYASGLTLDVHARTGLRDAPALVYLHPGSWMRGEPGTHARTLLHRLAESGWVVLDVHYPLSPAATFPEHLEGVRRAIAWAKTEGTDHGVDPRRVAVAGASAGGHLAALAALTWDHPALDDGVGNTSVIACVALYGIYDLLVRNQTRNDWPFIAREVLKATPGEAPGLYRLASPIDQVRPDAPPFLLIHGSSDSIVLAAESQHFAAALEAAGAPVSYHAVRWAQHGFDAIASVRTRAVADLSVAWLQRIAREHADEADRRE